ncbi:Cytochrome P450 [Operophtera brumata]|uniref:Cytochrome P450 n=1 Tax=Operophtera brumata TaxID=104452 RepID=A0A0L7KLR4_OPEBR|nr:Cytochrome P450 [Operophtera brumata]
MLKSKDANETNVESEFKPFMDSILEISQSLEGGLTDEDIMYETNNIVGGGFDTSTVTLTVALTLLGTHPGVQQRAYDEILQILGDSDRDIEKDDLPKFVYLEAVLKETLRLHPAGPLTARHVDKDVELSTYLVSVLRGSTQGNLEATPSWTAYSETCGQGHGVEYFKVSADDTKLIFKMDTLARPHSGHFISIQRRL